jgi:hypothetical protein
MFAAHLILNAWKKIDELFGYCGGGYAINI